MNTMQNSTLHQDINIQQIQECTERMRPYVSSQTNVQNTNPSFVLKTKSRGQIAKHLSKNVILHFIAKGINRHNQCTAHVILQSNKHAYRLVASTLG